MSERANERAREVTRGIPRKANARISAEALSNQKMVNAIRQILGLDDLYIFADQSSPAPRVYEDWEHSPKTSRKLARMPVRLAGDYCREPHSPPEQRERGAIIRNSINRQIERDKAKARARERETT